MPRTSSEKPQIPFEHLRQDHWTDEDSQNAATIVDFLQRLMNDHDFEYVLATFEGGSYVQHNRAIPSGIPGVVGYLRTLTRRFPGYSYDVKRIISSGGFVVVHSHVTLRAKDRGNERKGFIISDTFRLENGRLAEHWDAMQAIDIMARVLMLLTGGTIANKNPTF